MQFSLKTTTALACALLLSTAALSAKATVTKTNEKIPGDGEFDVPECGVTITVTGTVHALTHATANASGGFQAKFHFNPQGITGVDEHGGVYQGTSVTQGTDTMGPGQTSSFVNNFRLIGHGKTPSLLVHAVAHTTLNANGEATSTVDLISVECK